MTKPNPGDLIEITTKDEKIKGILMPRPELLDKETIIIKLKSGYNIGINKKEIKKTKIIEKHKKSKKKISKLHHNKNLPIISILHTGGTIASKVDYHTGGVISEFTPAEIINMFPELEKIANIKSRLFFQMFSEDFEPEHWSLLAKEIQKEIKSGVDGIILTHGTDTMHYTSAALSFMLQNLPIPVLLVGAQRSSDRGSSDAGMNLVCAANFIVKSDFSGIAICMHGSIEDKCCYIHQATKARKLHTSRRDAFRSINVFPYAKIFYDGNIKFLRKDYMKKDKKRKLNLANKFEKKTAIIKLRPGFNHKELDSYKNYKGIVLEGTGLGNAPVTFLDKYTKKHKEFLELLRKLSKKMMIVMTSQCIYGRINMNVYSTGRELQSAGILQAEDMLPEVAYVKLGWLLGNKPKQAKKLFRENLVGEITERIDEKAFLY